MPDWKYPERGEYPQERDMNVSDRCVIAEVGCPYVQVGYYDFGLQQWFKDGFSYPVPVYAWHYDKPPRVEA